MPKSKRSQSRPSSSAEKTNEATSKARRGRTLKVYDAVAGRVGVAGVIRNQKTYSSNGGKPKRGNVPIAADELLFQRQNAPVRYEEDDIYFAHRHLQPHQRLPNSDLLKAVHAYTADFYAATAPQTGRQPFEFMDETALLTAGILLEEAAKETLGDTGDLALLEGDEEHGAHGDQGGYPSAWNGERWVRSVIKRPKQANKSL